MNTPVPLPCPAHRGRSQGVVSATDYKAMVTSLVSGVVCALELKWPGGSTQQVLRKFVGPADVEVAQALFPSSLRGKYGEDKVGDGPPPRRSRRVEGRRCAGVIPGGCCSGRTDRTRWCERCLTQRPRSWQGENAVHCTDLAEDTELELEYFFSILSS